MLQKCSLGLLDLLLVYFNNALKGNNLPINSANKFLVKVMDQNGQDILNSAGYKLRNNYWILEKLNLVKRVNLEILAYMGFNGMGDVLSKYNVEFKQGAQILAKDLGFLGKIDTSKYRFTIPVKPRTRGVYIKHSKKSII